MFANDISAKKRDIYAENFDSSDYCCGDIRDITGNDIPNVEIATASFPCTDLSLAGNRAGLSGSASSTLLEFLRILDEMQDRKPPVVMLENVTGFVTSSSGKDLYQVVSILNALGYRCDLLLIDAKWFVPQSRQRLFIVGCTEIDSEPQDPKADNYHPRLLIDFIGKHRELEWQISNFPQPPERNATLSSVVETLDPNAEEWWDVTRLSDFLSSLSTIQATRLEEMRRSSRNCVATAYRRTRHGQATWEIRSDDISGCLRTNGGGSSKQALVEAGLGAIRVRWMTAREYARLQGAQFFKFVCATESQAKFAFGDGVCVPAVAWLARHCLIPRASRLANFITSGDLTKESAVLTA